MRLKNPKERGEILERKSRRRREAAGANVVRAGGSLGMADLVALYPEQRRVEIVQVKGGRWPGSPEMAALRGYAGRIPAPCSHCGSVWQVVIERWDRYAREPQVQEVTQTPAFARYLKD